MNIRDLRERIDLGLNESLRKAYYYSDLSRILRWWLTGISVIIALVPIIVIFLLQMEGKEQEQGGGIDAIVTILLVCVSALQIISSQIGLENDMAVSRIVGTQMGKLSEKWKLLAIDPKREDAEWWIEQLEDLTDHMTVEHLHVYSDKLNSEKEEEVVDAIRGQFENSDAEA